MLSNKKNVLVLLSGGIDSTACVDYYLTQQQPVSAIFIDYGQLSANKERCSATAICDYYEIPLSIVKCSGLKQFSESYILGRNAFLLNTGLITFEYNTGIIALGIHSGTTYCDCSEQFIRYMQTLFDFYTDGCISIGTPFLDWSKQNIWDYCISRKVPIEATYSCELGKRQPCGQCSSCKDLEVLYAG